SRYRRETRKAPASPALVPSVLGLQPWTPQNGEFAVSQARCFPPAAVDVTGESWRHCDTSRGGADRRAPSVPSGGKITARTRENRLWPFHTFVAIARSPFLVYCLSSTAWLGPSPISVWAGRSAWSFPRHSQRFGAEWRSNYGWWGIERFSSRAEATK